VEKNNNIFKMSHFQLSAKLGLRAFRQSYDASYSIFRRIYGLKPTRTSQPKRSLLTSTRPSSNDQEATTSSILFSSTSIDDAIEIACQSIGRVPGEAEKLLAIKLTKEWYPTASDVAAMSDEQAATLGVPLRLKSVITTLLQQQQNNASSTLATKNATQQQQTTSPLSESTNKSLFDVFFQSNNKPAAHVTREEEENEERAAIYSNDVDFTALDQEEEEEVEDQIVVVETIGTADIAASLITSDDGDSLPIEERICPPLQRFGYSWVKDKPKVTGRTKPEKYAIGKEELTPQLKQEFEDFHTFLTKRFFGQQMEPIANVTCEKYQDHARAVLGYCHRERGIPLAELSLKTVIPTSDREGVHIVFEYIEWLRHAREIGIRTEALVIRSMAALAKYIHHKDSKIDRSSGEKPYDDLGVVKELRRMSNDAKRAGRIAPRQSDEAVKWLDWPKYLWMVEELRKECAGLEVVGGISKKSSSKEATTTTTATSPSITTRPRSDRDIASSIMKYLIFAILSSVPDRQRTLRELRVGKTLVKDASNRWIIKHGPTDYKTGRSYGERPPLVIAPRIYPMLEAYISTWRAHLDPQHDYLLTQDNGNQFTDKSLYKLFWTNSYRLTGMRLNPHLVRDSIVTYLRGGGATERELEALALYMGHSVEMQRSTYDRRTKEEKVEPAVELLESLRAKAMLTSAAAAAAATEGAGA
jgi:hypothetical protein